MPPPFSTFWDKLVCTPSTFAFICGEYGGEQVRSITMGSVRHMPSALNPVLRTLYSLLQTRPFNDKVELLVSNHML